MTQVVRGLYNLPKLKKPCVVTIGNFDGVHCGHQALLAKLVAEARQRQVPAVVLTFEPQPAEYFAKGQVTVARLTKWREKFHALAKAGIDQVLVLRFDAWLAGLSAEDFIEVILCQGLKAEHVIVGDDFRFGHQRQGDFEFLKKTGASKGFSVETMTSLLLDGERVSSTRVRLVLTQGHQALAEKLLGRPFTLEGRVVHGAKRGRTIGFPTANIYLHRHLTPVLGVYAVRMHGITNKGLAGVANVGVRPTVNGTRCLLEVHVFDFDQDIYGRHVSVEFCHKLRDEKRFADLQALQAQIWQDAAEAKQFFTLI